MNRSCELEAFSSCKLAIKQCIAQLLDVHRKSQDRSASYGMCTQGSIAIINGICSAVPMPASLRSGHACIPLLTEAGSRCCLLHACWGSL